MKKILKRFSAVILAFALAVCVDVGPAQAADTLNVFVNVTYGQTEARSMLSMINSFRTGSDAWAYASDGSVVTYNDLEPLNYDYNLEKIAMQRAAEAAISFSHTRPNGTSWSALYSSFYGSKGENIAANYSSSAAYAFNQWQETDKDYSGQGHRRNMLSSNFNAIGIGHVEYNGVHFWVQELGYTSSSTTVTTANDSAAKVSVDVSSDYVTSKSVGANVNSISLELGETVNVPELTTKLLLASSWPSALKTVSVANTWSSNNSGIAVVSVGKVTGKAVGSTSITTTVWGETITIPVTVTCSHKNTKSTVTKATTGKNGTIVEKCTACGKTISTSTIYYPKKVTLSATSFTYNGAVKKPSVSVYDSSGKKISSANYTLTYASGRKNVGQYSVKITFKGNYSGSITKTFKILPAVSKVTALTAKSKGFTAKWSKKTTQTSGYQLQYSTSSKFTASKTKTKNITNNKTTSKTITGLKSKTRYYVRVRTYRTVTINGKSTKLYSAWSAVKSVKTK